MDANSAGQFLPDGMIACDIAITVRPQPNFRSRWLRLLSALGSGGARDGSGNPVDARAWLHRRRQGPGRGGRAGSVDCGTGVGGLSDRQPRNSNTAAMNADGASRCGTWPTSGTPTNRARAILPAKPSAISAIFPLAAWSFGAVYFAPT